MRKKTWIALVLALALGLGTCGMVFAGSFTQVDTGTHASGQPVLPTYVQPDYGSPLDEMVASSVSYKFATAFLWLVP